MALSSEYSALKFSKLHIRVRALVYRYKGIPRRLVVSAQSSLAVKLKIGVSSATPESRLFT
jgi:hypothetical protein